MKAVQQQIQALKIQLESIQRADRYRQGLERKLTPLYAELDRLAAAVDKGKKDITELEKWSLQEIFVKIIDKEKHLEQEKGEYLQAVMAYRNVKQEVEMLEFEIGILKEKVSTQSIVELELRKLYDRRQAEIFEQEKDHPLKPVLEQLARWNQIIREQEEAIIHGVNIQLILDAVSRHLIRAKSWTANPMRDPGYCNQMIAKEVDEARLRLLKLRLEFVKFEKEIEEIFQYPEFEDWREDQLNELRQVQLLIKKLFHFTKDFLRELTLILDLPLQLHQSHILSDEIRRQVAASVKWLRLEQGLGRQKIDRIQQKKENLLS